MKKIIIFIIFILFLLCSVNIWANTANVLDSLPGPEIMPDSSFYPLKIWYEKIVTFFSFGDAKKAERYSKLSEKRLYEIEKMAEKGKEKLTQKLLEEYKKLLNKAFSKVEEMKKEAQDKAKQEAKEKINQTLEKVSDSALKNQEILLKIYEPVSPEVKETIEGAIKLTKTGYERIMESVSGIKKEELESKAEEIRIKAQEIIKGWRKLFEE